MVQGVAADLTGVGHRPDDLRVRLGGVRGEQERRVDALPVQDLKEARRAAVTPS